MRKKPCPDDLKFHPELPVPFSAARRKRYIQRTMLLLLSAAAIACSARYYTECLATTPFTGISGTPEESASARDQATATRRSHCRAGVASGVN